MTNKTRPMAALMLSAFSVIGCLSLNACSKQGPLQRAGEEVDEAIDTAKHGGKESTANKVDDAVDDLRNGAEKAADDVKSK